MVKIQKFIPLCSNLQKENVGIDLGLLTKFVHALIVHQMESKIFFCKLKCFLGKFTIVQIFIYYNELSFYVRTNTKKKYIHVHSI
jgi:hypothetical protein